jgi:NTP pyrophosphatase (non-canonical NTP hydrolase)
MHNHESSYDEFVADRPKHESKQADLLHITLGISGEVGEIMELMKKATGPHRPEMYAPAKMALEIGDVVFYLTKLAHFHSLTIEDCIAGNRMKLNRRKISGKDHAAEESAMTILLNRRRENGID